VKSAREPAAASHDDDGHAAPGAYQAFDHLATLVAVVRPDGRCVFANATFEQVLGLSRRAVQRSNLFEWFGDADRLRDTVAAVAAYGGSLDVIVDDA